ncbi:MAG: M15 family metallopeptidase [Clostridiales Family XIII bacterium]|jgi:D-alanyl-D-alanine carboxypeptidase|nr:M15 family metallopeptidase [Clostridiales Family XIII bacterium]
MSEMLERAVRKKYKLKKQAYFIIGVFVLVVILFIGVIASGIVNTIRLEHRGYKADTVHYFKEHKLTKLVVNNEEYAEALDKAIFEDEFEDKYAKDYFDISYSHAIKDFEKNVNLLLKKGYSGKTASHIVNNLSKEDTDYILEAKYDDGIADIFNTGFSANDKFLRYINFRAAHPELSTKNIVTYVNIGLDQANYTDAATIEAPADLLVLVNKHNKIPDNYEPDDLVILPVDISAGEQMLRKDAAKHFEKMAKAILEEKELIIKADSSYRDRNRQGTIYNQYVTSHGQEAADIYAVMAGFSEHQTGLGVDIANKFNDDITPEMPQYDWLRKNAYKYGFVYRYPDDKQDITGFNPEPWHYRYVGEKTAKKVHDSKLTLDEYIAQLPTKSEDPKPAD